ncbi:MAG: MFS transporter [Pirellulales bacterium]|nr:MFS transporter [Pirellulales bacterium]
MSESKPYTAFQRWLVLVAAFLGWMFDGVEMGLFPIVIRPALLSLGMTSDSEISQWNGIVVAAFLLGCALGGVVFGWLGDKLGRVRTMTVAILIYSLFTGACALATAPWQLGVFRFIASLGMGGEWALAVALVMECWPEKHRPKLAGAIGAAANFGFLFIAVVGSVGKVTEDAWRWVMLVGACPALLAFIVIAMVPESQRWKDSLKLGKSQPLREVFGPGLRKKTLFGIIFASIPLIGTWAAVSGWTPSWVEQIKQVEVAAGPGFLTDEQQQEVERADTFDERVKLIRGYTKIEGGKQIEVPGFLASEQWKEVESIASPAKSHTQIALSIGAILGCFVAPVLAGFMGRRPIYFGLCLLSLLSCAYLYRYVDSYGLWFLFVTFVAGGITASFYGWLPLYLPELFPTRVRATGQGICFNLGRVLAAVGALYMGQLVSLLGGDYALACANITLVYILGMILIWFVPETKGKPLPE